MSRYVVVPIPTSHGIEYAVRDVGDDDKMVACYGCETWAVNKAKELNAVPDKHLSAWTALLDRANRAKPRKCAQKRKKAGRPKYVRKG